MENSRRRFHRRPHGLHPGSWRLRPPYARSRRYRVVSPQKGILHSPFSENHKGVSHLSPRRSYPNGSSFSSFSILRSPRRCDNPYLFVCQNFLEWKRTHILMFSVAHRDTRDSRVAFRCARGGDMIKLTNWQVACVRVFVSKHGKRHS